jgi:D-glycero-D-manno-heptose 1,7-bisphosphate phosphatase|tara:strand:+ start:1345 stop:1911 length:567 start_codon:yes stop_codon:yes gene_type:complete
VTPAVFLDRDGTLIEEVGYLDRIERIELYPWSVDAVRVLNRAGFKVVVVTNQAGVARAMFDEAFVGEAHAFIDARLREGGAVIDGFYYCPHHPDAPVEAYRKDCDCRKPRTGMVEQAQRDLDLDLGRSFVVGDRWLDVELGMNFGGRGILVRTGYGEAEVARPKEGVDAELVAPDLMTAVSWILQQAA